MIDFKDGPAAGTSLTLARAPIYLRVVIDETTGQVDALDQMDDTPGPSERIHVYRRTIDGGMVHVCGRGSRHGRGCSAYVMASYEHMPDVDGESVRVNERWRAWALARPEARPRAEALG